jgi:hypothetical protein
MQLPVTRLRDHIVARIPNRYPLGSTIPLSANCWIRHSHSGASPRGEALPILMNDAPILIERQSRSVPSLIWPRWRSTTSFSVRNIGSDTSNRKHGSNERCSVGLEIGNNCSWRYCGVSSSAFKGSAFCRSDVMEIVSTLVTAE